MTSLSNGRGRATPREGVPATLMGGPGPGSRDALDAWYERQVDTLTNPVDSMTVVTTAGPTHVLASRNAGGPAVVVLPGMNMNAAAMADAIEHLGPWFRVYALDVIGMPGRSARTHLSRRDDAYPIWLTEVMDGLDLARASFVGHSFGGWLTLKLAALAPERIERAVLMSPGGIVPLTVRGQIASSVAAFRFRARPTEANRERACVRPFYAPGSQPDPRIVELFALAIRNRRFEMDGLPPVMPEELRGFEAPTFILYGGQDLFFDVPRALDRAADLFNVARRVAMPRQGHIFDTEATAHADAEIASFLTAA